KTVPGRKTSRALSHYCKLRAPRAKRRRPTPDWAELLHQRSAFRQARKPYVRLGRPKRPSRSQPSALVTLQEYAGTPARSWPSASRAHLQGDDLVGPEQQLAGVPMPAKTGGGAPAEKVRGAQRGASRKPQDGRLLAAGGVVAADMARVRPSSGRDRRDDDAGIVRSDEVRVAWQPSGVRLHERSERRVGVAVRICSDVSRVARALVGRQSILETMLPRPLRLRGLQLGPRGSVARAQIGAGEPSHGAQQRERERAALRGPSRLDLRDPAVEEDDTGAPVGEQRERLLRSRADRCLEVAPGLARERPRDHTERL